MRGGGRSKSHKGSPGAVSVRALKAEAHAAAKDKEIADALKTMTSDERIHTYISMNERHVDEDDEEVIAPQFRKRFNEIFHKDYNEDAQIAREIMANRMEPGPFAGGKTRRNRRRRGRRSLKRKHSKRR